MRGLAVALVLVAAFGGPALAQEPGGTMTASPSVAATKDATDAQIADWIRKGSAADPIADSDGGVTTEPGPRKVHGEASLAFGSHGYRDAYVTSSIPVGATGTLDLGVRDTQYDSKAFGHQEQKSLYVGLFLGGPAQARCEDLLKVDGHYVGPLWVDRLRDAAPGRRFEPGHSDCQPGG